MQIRKRGPFFQASQPLAGQVPPIFPGILGHWEPGQLHNHNRSPSSPQLSLSLTWTPEALNRPPQKQKNAAAGRSLEGFNNDLVQSPCSNSFHDKASGWATNHIPVLTQVILNGDYWHFGMNENVTKSLKDFFLYILCNGYHFKAWSFCVTIYIMKFSSFKVVSFFVSKLAIYHGGSKLDFGVRMIWVLIVTPPLARWMALCSLLYFTPWFPPL